MGWFDRQQQHNNSSDPNKPAEQQDTVHQSAAPTMPSRSGGLVPPLAPSSAVTEALDAFISAPGWSQTRAILEQRQAVLLSLEGRMAAVQRLEGEQDQGKRMLLGMCVRLLLIAREQGIPSAWAWLDAYHEQMRQAAEALRQQLDQLPPDQRRQVERALQALDQSGGATPSANTDDDDDDENDQLDDSDPSAVLQAFLTTRTWGQTFRILERHQRVLLSGGSAAQALRALAARLREDQQEDDAKQVDLNVWILEHAARDGIATTRTAFFARRDHDRSDPSRPPSDTPSPASPLVPTLDERQAAQSLLAQGGLLDEVSARALRAWLGEPGVTATPDEITRALSELHDAMQYLS